MVSILTPAMFFPVQACLDQDGSVEAKEGRPLLNLLSDPQIGGWKVASSPVDAAPALRDRRTFQHLLEHLQREYQVLGFFSWSVGEDDKNSSRHVIQVRN